MATYTKLVLSGSSNGKLIKVTGAVSTDAVTLHTAVSNTTDEDEIWLYANNNHTTDVNLTILWGGSTTDDEITMAIPNGSGLYQIVPGLILRNSNVVSAYAGVANVVYISGFVNRITQ